MSKLLFITYNLITFFLVPFVYIKLRYSKKEICHGTAAKQLLGIVPKRDYKSPVWIHTVSVGEAQGALPLIKKLANSYPNQQFVVTTTTATGKNVYKNIPENVSHLYCPLDNYFCVRKFFNSVKPKALIIMETELWPNILKTACNHNIKTTIINARLSNKSCNSYLKIKNNFYHLITKNITKILCQNDNDKSNFLKLGFTNEQIKVFGSLKYDIEINEEKRKIGEAIKNKSLDKNVVCFASTHIGEDEKIISKISDKDSKIPNNTIFLLIPRHPERFEEVYKLSSSKFKDTIKFTDIQKNDYVIPKNAKIIIGDTMGDMITYFSFSDIVFMGGSLITRGGHNPIEPAILHKAILTGPHIFNFKQVYKELQENNACILSSEESFIEDINVLLEDTNKRLILENNAYNTIIKNQGAIVKTFKELEEIYKF
jgi:3-deoxy-D-manno-octulosonic-acid transferase